MIKISISRLAMTLAVSAALSGVGALPAVAGPDDGRARPGPHRIVVLNADQNCPLRRLDRQFVRCDNLTGAGVPAPSYVPELSGHEQIRLCPNERAVRGGAPG